jgi:uncharacterized protein (DUF697 family)
MTNDTIAMELMNKVLSHGVDGIGPLMSSRELVQTYKSNSIMRDKDSMIQELIKWETSKSFGTGFVTGLGGALTLPVSVPASLYATWLVQARLAGAIAQIYGHNVKSDHVRTFILLTLIGDAAKDVLKEIGMEIGEKLALQAIKKIPGRILIQINKKVGFRLITKAGEKGVINLTKIIPLVGGIIGGAVDASSTYTAGKIAKKVFKKGPVLTIHYQEAL